MKYGILFLCSFFIAGSSYAQERTLSDTFDALMKRAKVYKNYYKPLCTEILRQDVREEPDVEIQKKIWNNPHTWTIPFCRGWKKGLIHTLSDSTPEKPSYMVSVLSILCDAMPHTPHHNQVVQYGYVSCYKSGTLLNTVEGAMFNLCADIGYFQDLDQCRYTPYDYSRIFNFLSQTSNQYAQFLGFQFGSDYYTDLYKQSLLNFLDIYRLRVLYKMMPRLSIAEKENIIQPVYNKAMQGDPVAIFELGRFFLYKGPNLEDQNIFWDNQNDRYHRGLCFLKLAFSIYRSSEWLKRLKEDELSCAFPKNVLNKLFLSGKSKKGKAHRVSWDQLLDYTQSLNHIPNDSYPPQNNQEKWRRKKNGKYDSLKDVTT